MCLGLSSKLLLVCLSQAVRVYGAHDQHLHQRANRPFQGT
jgi:hypothetical protein